MTTRDAIIKECEFFRDLLVRKNKEYGDSAIHPVKIFSNGPDIELINIRIDDKLSRIKNRGKKTIKEDTVADLIGYLILKRIKEREVE